MEDEKKKKRNKKKKNKQQHNNHNDNNKVTAGESTSIHLQQDHVTDNGLSATNNHVSESTDAETDVKDSKDSHLPPSNDDLAQADKQYWLERVARFGEKIKQLQKEKDEHSENEAALSEKVENLLKEKDIILQKEASLEEKLKQLKNEKHGYEEKQATLQAKIEQLEKEIMAHMQKEASLEEKVREMQKEKESLMLEKGELEMKFMHLQGEKQSWLQKEAGFEEKINLLMDEAATISLKGVSLEEKIKQMERESESWAQKENSRKATITNLDGENTKLRAEVLELKEQRDSLLHENQLLKEDIFGLRSHIRNLEKSAERQMDTSGNGDVNSEMGAEHMLAEKLITENAELVEKVNALYVELARRSLTEEASSFVDSQPKSVSAEPADLAEASFPTPELVDEAAERRETGQAAEPLLDSSIKILSSGERLQSMEEVGIEEEKTVVDYLNADNNTIVPNSYETDDSDKIVQIALDENETPVVDSGSAHDEEKIDVPLTEAPLIGAPFRLISFFARYVSGADLVNKSSSNSGG